MHSCEGFVILSVLKLKDRINIMKKAIYLVGGACRDMVLGITPKDLDFVAVGYTQEDFNLWESVGKDFPVYLQPLHKWEVALARTERKSGTGYRGFTTETNGVTLEEDLSRRDLTANSIAIEVDFAETIRTGVPVTIGTWIDPHNGIQDIKDKTLRHTTEAFAEDPLRVLRVARFMARFGQDWTIAPETKLLMDEIYYSGELVHLTPERVWLETEKALGEVWPSLYFETLRLYVSVFPYSQEMFLTQAVNDHHPELDVFQHCKMVMDYAAQTFNDHEVVWAGYCHDIAKPKCFVELGKLHGHEAEGVPLVEELCAKYKVPNRYKELALIVTEYHGKVHNSLPRNTNKGMRPKSIMSLFEATGALKKPERFKKMLMSCQSDAAGRGVDVGDNIPYEHTKEFFLSKDYPQRRYLEECLEAVLSEETKLACKEISTKLLSEGKQGVTIGLEIRSQKIKAIRQIYNKWSDYEIT